MGHDRFLQSPSELYSFRDIQTFTVGMSLSYFIRSLFTKSSSATQMWAEKIVNWNDSWPADGLIRMNFIVVCVSLSKQIPKQYLKMEVEIWCDGVN
jgi:hypothetical protein